MKSSQAAEQALKPLEELPDTVRKLQGGQGGTPGMTAHLRDALLLLANMLVLGMPAAATIPSAGQVLS